ncbi:MAG: hypothetical protein MUO58_16690 [Anaerolineales bacterium]|nr:hypothetical protein [Anaerolineales bacterium]
MKYTNAAAERIPPKMDAMRVKDHGRRKNDSGNFRDYFLPITSITHKQLLLTLATRTMPAMFL